MLNTIAVMNTKGGVGKSTLVLALAETMSAYHGKNVLVIDSDAQASVSAMLMSVADLYALQQDGRTIVDYLVATVLSGAAADWTRFIVPKVSDVDDARGVYVLPSDMQLTLLEREVSKESQHTRLRTAIGRLLADAGNVFDVVLIDCPPGLSVLTECWLREADFHISPTKPDYVSICGLEVFRRFKALNPEMGFARNLGVIVNLEDSTSSTDTEYTTWLGANADNRCFSQTVPRVKALQDAARHQSLDRSYAAKYPGAIGTALRALTTEVLERLQVDQTAAALAAAAEEERRAAEKAAAASAQAAAAARQPSPAAATAPTPASTPAPSATSAAPSAPTPATQPSAPPATASGPASASATPPAEPTATKPAAPSAPSAPPPATTAAGDKSTGDTASGDKSSGDRAALPVAAPKADAAPPAKAPVAPASLNAPGAPATASIQPDQAKPEPAAVPQMPSAAEMSATMAAAAMAPVTIAMSVAAAAMAPLTNPLASAMPSAQPSTPQARGATPPPLPPSSAGSAPAVTPPPLPMTHTATSAPVAAHPIAPPPLPPMTAPPAAAVKPAVAGPGPVDSNQADGQPKSASKTTAA